MYERNSGRNLGKFRQFTSDLDILFWLLGCNFIDCLIFFHGLINPIINGDSAFCVLFYFIGQFQTWHLSLPHYIVEGGSTDIKFLCYTSLFLVIILHPFSKFIHFILSFYFFFWTKIRYSDTIVTISQRGVENNIFVRSKEKALTYIYKNATI
jgi:hypothetical protein